MFERISTRLWSTALGPAIVIWGFGYLLADIVATLLGRAPPGVSFLTSLPLFLLGVCQTEALDMIRARFEQKKWVIRSLATLPAAMIAVFIQAFFDLYWTRYLALTLFPSWQQYALQINSQRVTTYLVIYLWIFCLALILLWAARASRASAANAARAALAEAEAAKAQSAALRLQLNPHFLFNTMNSISSLVTLDRKAEAEEMMERLCEFLRASLNADPMEDVPLAHEIDTIDAYLSIEATRFGDRLEIDIDVAPDVVDAKVPNFILQPFVENAIKHGVSLMKGPASLSVAAARDGEDLVLTVSNSADPEARAAADPLPSGRSTGIGITNSRERLRNRYGDGGQLITGPTPDGYRAIIRFPFRSSRAA